MSTADRLRGLLSSRTAASNPGATAGPTAARRTLVILSTPRSGTHLLAHELASTGQIGLAEEFFHDELATGFAERFDADAGDLHGYIRAWHEQTAATSGVAAVVVFPDHVNKLAAAGKLGSPGPDGFIELVSQLPDPQVVLLERQSLVEQAISFNRATQSWVWTRTAGQAAPEHPPYDFESLSAHLLRLVTIRQWSLTAADLAGERLGLRLLYESLVADPEQIVRRVCDMLDLSISASHRTQTERPERAADSTSAARAEQLLGDIASLTAELRWSPGAGSVESVAGKALTVADRQLSALSDAVAAHQASAYRRRPVADPLPNAGSLVALESALGAAQHKPFRRLRVLTHGLDQWILQAQYGESANAGIDVSFSPLWADLVTQDLSSNDIVHINSMSLGWGHTNFDGKSALIDRARAVIASLVQADIPIVWSVNEPITPGTSHVKLESMIRAELAAASSVIHVPNDSVLERAQSLFAVPADRVVVGELGGLGMFANTDRPVLAPETAAVFAVVGGLASLPRLGDLVELIPAIFDRFGSDATVVVTGHDEGHGAVAHQLRQLRSAGAVVVEGAVDVPVAAALVARSAAVLVPGDDNAWFVPQQQLGSYVGAPVVMTSCPAVTNGIGVDWTSHGETLDALARASTTVHTPADDQPRLSLSALMAKVQ